MKSYEDHNTEAGVVADLAAAAARPLINVKREGVAVFPDGQVINLENERLADNPRRRRASVALVAALSFVEYLQRFSVPGRTIIFGQASETGGSFKAIVNYHDVERIPNVLPDSTDKSTLDNPKPQWGDHVVTLKLSPTPEWSRWIAKNNVLIPQADFAEFIEDNAADIVAPDAAHLLDMASFLQGKKTVTFKSGRNLNNGTTQLVYSEEIENNAGRRDDTTLFPTHMIVRLRPFVGSAGVEIPARLRFRISESGKLSFQYVLDRPFKVIEEAFNAICAEFEAKLQIPVLLGTGEVNPPEQIHGA